MSQQSIFYVGDPWEVWTASVTNARTGASVKPAKMEALFVDPHDVMHKVEAVEVAGVWVASKMLDSEGTWTCTFRSPEGEWEGVETVSIEVKRAPGT